MTADVYCTDEDLYLYGLPRGLLTSPGRQVATVYPATDILELDGHGFGDATTRTSVVFRAESGGSLPAEIVAGTTYYAERLSDSTCQIYAAPTGGAAINITTAGSLVFVSTSLPSAQVRERYSRFADARIPHLVPLAAPYPITIVAIVAELAAQRLLWISGQRSIAMADIEAAAHKELEAFGRGAPVRDARVTASSNLAVSSPVTTGGRGWTPALRDGVEVIP